MTTFWTTQSSIITTTKPSFFTPTTITIHKGISIGQGLSKLRRENTILSIKIFLDISTSWFYNKTVSFSKIFFTCFIIINDFKLSRKLKLIRMRICLSSRHKIIGKRLKEVKLLLMCHLILDVIITKLLITSSINRISLLLISIFR